MIAKVGQNTIHTLILLAIAGCVGDILAVVKHDKYRIDVVIVYHQL